MAVPANPNREPITLGITSVEGRLRLPPDPHTGQPRPVAEVTLDECHECRARDTQVEQMLTAVRWHRDPTATHHARRALDALATLGQPPPDKPTRQTLRALLWQMGRTNESVRWAARFATHLADPDDISRCALRPWAHVTDDTRAVLRRQFATYLAQRSAEGAPPVQVSPPPLAPEAAATSHPIEGGCVLCGVASVTVPATEVAAHGGRARAAANFWRAVKVRPSAVGGAGSPYPLSGHACPDCAQVMAEVGAVGLTACERSLRRHLRAAGRHADARFVREGETVGLVAWGALAHASRGDHTVPPNAEPWAHVRMVA